MVVVHQRRSTMAEKQFDNEGRVSIWANDSDNERAPQYTGTVLIDGVMRTVSLWENESETPNAPVFRGQIQKKISKK